MSRNRRSSPGVRVASALLGTLVLLGLSLSAPAYAVQPAGLNARASHGHHGAHRGSHHARHHGHGSTHHGHGARSAHAGESSSGGSATSHSTSGTSGTSGDVHSPQPQSTADQNGTGANHSGPYDSTRDGSPSGNGNGNGAATGKPCAGCVGKADNKFPPGQAPGGSDHNAGYECDRNHGIGRSNPAHTGCRSTDASGSANLPPLTPAVPGPPPILSSPACLVSLLTSVDECEQPQAPTGSAPSVPSTTPTLPTSVPVSVPSGTTPVPPGTTTIPAAVPTSAPFVLTTGACTAIEQMTGLECVSSAEEHRTPAVPTAGLPTPGSAAGSTVPGSGTPAQGSTPGSTVPGSTGPASTGSGSTGPASTVPGSTPGSVSVGSRAPGSVTSVPGTGSTVPGSTPVGTAPGSAVPGSTVPGSSVPGSTVRGSTPVGTSPPVVTTGITSPPIASGPLGSSVGHTGSVAPSAALAAPPVSSAETGVSPHAVEAAHAAAAAAGVDAQRTRVGGVLPQTGAGAVLPWAALVGALLLLGGSLVVRRARG